MLPANPHTASAFVSLPRMPASTGTVPASASAAPKPCSTRPAMRISNVVAKPHTSDATENTPNPIPAKTCPRTRRSSGSTATAPITIAML